MWCIAEITAEYRERMYALLALYARPYRAQEPVVCVDETSKQLLRQTRAGLRIDHLRAAALRPFVAAEPAASALRPPL